MQTIVEHEFLQSPEGELSLVLDVINFDAAEDPVLLVSKFENTAYLRRAKDDVHEIVGINPDVIGSVREAQFIVIVEMLADKVTHSYGVPTGILEDDDEDDSEGESAAS